MLRILNNVKVHDYPYIFYIVDLDFLHFGLDVIAFHSFFCSFLEIGTLRLETPSYSRVVELVEAAPLCLTKFMY